MAEELVPVPPDGQLLIYDAGGLAIPVRLDGQSVWLTQRLIADLFQVSVKTVNEYLVNIYDEGELAAEATIRKFRTVQIEGEVETKPGGRKRRGRKDDRVALPARQADRCLRRRVRTP